MLYSLWLGALGAFTLPFLLAGIGLEYFSFVCMFPYAWLHTRINPKNRIAPCTCDIPRQSSSCYCTEEEVKVKTLRLEKEVKGKVVSPVVQQLIEYRESQKINHSKEDNYHYVTK